MRTEPQAKKVANGDKIIELDRGTCGMTPEMSRAKKDRLWKLEKGDKFVIKRDDGTVSESPWYFYKTEGMYATVAKRPNAEVREFQYILANAPVQLVS
jgi:hypothetical protein